MSELRGVLFDMDGTLTDSERLWTISLQEVAASHGGVIPPQTRSRMTGQDMWTTIDMLHEELGITDDPAVTASALTAATRAVFARGLPWMPGAQELLYAVRAAGLRTALVTATHRPLVEIALRTLGADNFDAVVTGDEVVNNKPDPEPYLRALELLDLPVSQCLAIEDSPAGSTSAAGAGLLVVVVPSETPVPPSDRLVFAESLVGMDVASLRSIFATWSTAGTEPLPTRTPAR